MQGKRGFSQCGMLSSLTETNKHRQAIFYTLDIYQSINKLLINQSVFQSFNRSVCLSVSPVSQSIRLSVNQVSQSISLSLCLSLSQTVSQQRILTFLTSPRSSEPGGSNACSISPNSKDGRRTTQYESKCFESYPNGQMKCLSRRLYFPSSNSHDYKPSNVPHNTRDSGHFPSDMTPETVDLLCQYTSVCLVIALLRQNSWL